VALIIWNVQYNESYSFYSSKGFLKEKAAMLFALFFYGPEGVLTYWWSVVLYAHTDDGGLTLGDTVRMPGVVRPVGSIRGTEATSLYPL